MKLLITGGSGYLGQHLTPIAAALHDVHHTFYSAERTNIPQAHQLDMRDTDGVVALIKKVQPDAIIHTAVSNRTDDVWGGIVDGARAVTTGAEATNAKLIHLSTDIVFNGEDAPYTEDSPVTPIHEYGRAKVESERIVAAYANHAIVRTSLIYSLHIMDMGTRWMKKSLEAGESFTLFSNHYRNPVYAPNLSHACLELASNAFTGILNVAGAQALPRSEFASKMFTFWGVDQTNVSAGPDESEGRFAKDVRLDLSKAKATLTTPLWGLDEVLRRSAENKLQHN